MANYRLLFGQSNGFVTRLVDLSSSPRGPAWNTSWFNSEGKLRDCTLSTDQIMNNTWATFQSNTWFFLKEEAGNFGNVIPRGTFVKLILSCQPTFLQRKHKTDAEVLISQQAVCFFKNCRSRKRTQAQKGYGDMAQTLPERPELQVVKKRERWPQKRSGKFELARFFVPRQINTRNIDNCPLSVWNIWSKNPQKKKTQKFERSPWEETLNDVAIWDSQVQETRSNQQM